MPGTSPITALTVSVALGLGVLGAAPASAQPDKRDTPGQERQADRSDPAQFRSRLARILELAERRVEELRSAIGALDRGGTAEEAIRILGGPERARLLASWLWEPSPGQRSDRPQPPEGREPDSPPEFDRAEVMAFLERNAPELASRIREDGDDGGRMLSRLTGRLGPRVAEIRVARAQDADLADLLESELRASLQVMASTWRLFGAKREGDEGTISEAEAELERAAGEMVELRLRRREHEVATLLRRAEELKADLEKQRSARDEMKREIIEGATRPFNRDRQGDRDRRPPRRGSDDNPGRGG